MASSNSVNYLFISFFLSLLLTLAFSDDPDCVYTVYVRTGSIIKGGTDSNVNLRLYDVYGYGIEITNLEAWGGLMGPGYNYFERGNLDIFSGPGPCLDSPICALNLTSDGSGPHHGWYVNYVEVTSTGVHIPCHQQLFTVEQWLATDTWPYELTAIRNYCNSADIEGAEKRGRTERRMIPSGSGGLVSTV
ncbi:PLAT domain-containing protein 3-like [Pyrus x bretschneideri]|uniref:PLAT domain-containing protein 3-like n=1 Tax=Pyrus x bretschneideri TaxID=225117 RepID=UPI00202F6376|nr:PLAT domain-containing protein 3-like [Pyrus x bretschneideri]